MSKRTMKFTEGDWTTYPDQPSHATLEIRRRRWQSGALSTGQVLMRREDGTTIPIRLAVKGYMGSGDLHLESDIGPFAGQVEIEHSSYRVVSLER